jgi:hypothetical protein
MTTQISSFITSLETHPRATELIPLVEQLLNVDDFSLESQLTEILLDICVDNPAMIIDLWLLRGTILMEEGVSPRAISIFWEAVHIQPTDPIPWNQVIQNFISREELIHASYFLTQAILIFPDNPELSSLLQEVSSQLQINLRNPPGVSKSLITGGDPQSSGFLLNGQTPPNANVSVDVFPVSFQNPWKMTQECLEGSLSSSNQKDKQSFVTYAHSAMRELLGLDGNFREGLDQALIRLKLTDYKRPLMYLNHIRNQVTHANHIPSKKEIRKFYTLVQEIVVQYEQGHSSNLVE